jgi:hypothetical protein
MKRTTLCRILFQSARDTLSEREIEHDDCDNGQEIVRWRYCTWDHVHREAVHGCGFTLP